jgi:predicted O-methyltransferase YrrM
METQHYKRFCETDAIKKVIESYNARGYQVILGNPDCLLTRLFKDGRVINASFAVSMSDIQVFKWIADMSPWQHALIIGNSFGFSTFIIAELCPGCYVDVIDAEVEGSENRLGSELTRKIAERDFPSVRLTIGFSPQDLPKACRFNDYDFIFIDGLHTNEQLIADFNGIRSLRRENSAVYCHDVGIAKMHEGWSQIKAEMLEENDEAFDLHFTSFGATIVVRGNPAFREFMRLICRPLNEVFYFFGSRHVGLRSAFRMLLRTFTYSTRYGEYLGRLRKKSRVEV